MKKLPLSFYQRTDTVQVARDLLGMFLVTSLDGVVTAAKIVETEAYCGVSDRACHAWNGRRTSRTEIMYHAGGVAYVYLIYGMYDMFNVVTHADGAPHAILVRAVEPVDGVEEMMARRKHDRLKRSLTAGPGILTRALGIRRAHSGLSLLGNQIWLEDRGVRIDEADILASPRVGVDYAGEDAALPYRFRVRDSKWTSPAK